MSVLCCESPNRNVLWCAHTSCHILSTYCKSPPPSLPQPPCISKHQHSHIHAHTHAWLCLWTVHEPLVIKLAAFLEAGLSGGAVTNTHTGRSSAATSHFCSWKLIWMPCVFSVCVCSLQLLSFAKYDWVQNRQGESDTAVQPCLKSKSYGL